MSGAQKKGKVLKDLSDIGDETEEQSEEETAEEATIREDPILGSLVQFSHVADGITYEAMIRLRDLVAKYKQDVDENQCVHHYLMHFPS